jgi:8-oxo-dGTP pyrophosphatase MutT (NUDIX family)
MGEAGQPQKGERGAAADGAKRRRRRTRRASARGTDQKAEGGAAPAGTEKNGTSARRATPTPTRSKSRKKASGAKTSSGKRSAKTRRKGRAAPTKREISAGGVVYRRDGDVIEIVLASRRTRRGELAWGLAKGGIEDDESMEDAAVREVREETGLLAEIEVSLGETRYFYVWENVRIRKTVHFFLMRHTGGDIDDRDDEMEEIRWFPLDRALKRAAYRGERDVLVRAAELLR